MSNRFTSGKKAIAECDICGFRYKLKELRNIVTNSSRDIQWGWNPVGDGNNIYELTVNNLQATAEVGEVTVTIS